MRVSLGIISSHLFDTRSVLFPDHHGWLVYLLILFSSLILTCYESRGWRIVRRSMTPSMYVTDRWAMDSIGGGLESAVTVCMESGTEHRWLVASTVGLTCHMSDLLHRWRICTKAECCLYCLNPAVVFRYGEQSLQCQRGAHAFFFKIQRLLQQQIRCESTFRTLSHWQTYFKKKQNMQVVPSPTFSARHIVRRRYTATGRQASPETWSVRDYW